MPPFPKVHVQTINYQSAAQVLGFVDSLREQDYPEIIVYVLDNSGELDRRECERRGAKYITAGKNLGFGSGHNFIFQQYTAEAGDVVIIANNDIGLPTADFISSFVTMVDGTRPEILSPVIECENGLWFSGATLHPLTGDIAHKRVPVSAGQKRGSIYVPGTFMIMRTSLFERLKGFDSDMFMYAEDVDLCLRASTMFDASVSVCTPSLFHGVGSGYSGNYQPIYITENTINRLRTLVRHGLGVFPINYGYFFGKYYLARTFQLLLRGAKLNLILRLWSTLPKALHVVMTAGRH